MNWRHLLSVFFMAGMLAGAVPQSATLEERASGERFDVGAPSLLAPVSTVTAPDVAASPAPPAFLATPGRSAEGGPQFSWKGIDLEAGFRTSAIDLSTGPGRSITIRFEGAVPVDPVPRGAPVSTNHFLTGADSAHWQTQVVAYGELAYVGLYPGIDVVFSANERGPKYEVRVASTSDLTQVRIVYEGASDVGLLEGGGLRIRSETMSLEEEAPVSWTSDGTTVACRFQMLEPVAVGFACDGWNRAHGLTIDPLVFSSYVGGTGSDIVRDVAVDDNGSIYVLAITYSANFPSTVGAFDVSNNGSGDIAVTKLARDGRTRTFSTFIGGASLDNPWDIAVDQNGTAYVAGTTQSTDFPTTAGANQSTCAGFECAFVLALAPDGSSLAFSTVLGANASTQGQGVGYSPDGTVYLVGVTYTPNLPTTPGAYNRTFHLNFSYADSFVARYDPTGALLSSTFFGGSREDYIVALAVDTNGYPYATGMSFSFDLPTTASAPYRTLRGGYDAFITKFERDLSGLQFSTFIGGTQAEFVDDIAVDSNGSAVIAIHTYSTDFPTTSGAYDRLYSGVVEGAVARLNAAGTALMFSTFLGGDDWDAVLAVAYAPNGSLFLTGDTASTDFPVVGPTNFTSRAGGAVDGFVTIMSANGTQVSYSSYFGGNSYERALAVAADPVEGLVFAGSTASTDLPMFNAIDGLTDGDEGFVVRLLPRAAIISVNSTVPGVTFTVNGTNQVAPFSLACDSGTRSLAVLATQGNATTRFVFTGWADGAGNPRTVMCNADASLTILGNIEHFVSFVSYPIDVTFDMDGFPVPMPAGFWFVEGSSHRIVAPPNATQARTQFELVRWNDGQPADHFISVLGPLVLEAEYRASRFELIFTSLPAGLRLVVDGTEVDSGFRAWYDNGSALGVDVLSPQNGTAGSRYVFVQWSDGQTGPHAVTASGPLDVVATFDTEYAVSFATNPANLELMVDGALVQTPLSLWWKASSTHAVRAAPGVIELGDEQYSFDHWGSPPSPANWSMAVLGPLSFLANFSVSAYRIVLASDPMGRQVLADSVASITPATFWLEPGSLHVFEAPTPQVEGESVFRFLQWEDGAPAFRPFTVSGPATLQASFELGFEVSFDSDPPRQKLRVDGDLLTAPWTFVWANGSSHTIGVDGAVVLGPGARLMFGNWSDGGAQNHTVSVMGRSELRASFSRWFLLVLSSSKGTPLCGASDCWYPANATATFSVDSIVNSSAGSRSKFVSWEGDATTTAPSGQITMDGSKLISALWIAQYFVTVTTPYAVASGEGWYDEGSTAAVSVSATEVAVAGTTYRFSGWTGKAVGAAPNITFTVTTPSQMTANWEAVTPEPPKPSPSGMTAGLIVLLGAALALWRRSRR